MNTLEAIQTRRSVKYFDVSQPLSDTQKRTLLELTLLSPTAFNLQHWRLVVVEDMALKEAIALASGGQQQVTQASLLAIFCADTQAWQKYPQRCWQEAPQSVQDYIIPKIDAYYRDKPQVQRDEVMRSCGIASQTLMLASRSMGFDSCPMDGFDFDAVAKLINLPDDHIIALMVAVGKKAQEPWSKSGLLSFDEVVFKNHF